jgi:pyrroloquinoline quinone (PQQ) biosynthesis protein C
MRVHLKQYTEPIYEELAGYRAQLVAHPLLTAARAGELSTKTLHEFAFHQYSDSILWIPMLAQMKGVATKSRRLRDAIEANIGHEAGLGGISHVTLAADFMRSLGITDLDGMPTHTFARDATEWLSADWTTLSEGNVAGWLLVAETLVPLMFAALEPSFAALGADTRYLREHVHVDSDEHARWMAESVDEIVDLYGPSCCDDIHEGMDIGWTETVLVPDALWRSQCASV